MTYTVEDFAHELGVSVEDCLYIARTQHGVEGELTNQDYGDLRNTLDPMCERSVWSIPELTQRDGLCRCTALGGREHGLGPECPQ